MPVTFTPTIADQLALTDARWVRMIPEGGTRYAAVIDETNGATIHIVDTLDYENLTVVDTVAEGAAWFVGGSWADVRGDVMAVHYAANDHLCIYDVSDPVNVVRTGIIQDAARLGVGGFGVIILDDTYVITAGNNVVSVWDISGGNPAFVTSASGLNGPGITLLNQNVLVAAGASGTGLRVYDISTPTTLSLVASRSGAGWNTRALLGCQIDPQRLAMVSPDIGGNEVEVLNLATPSSPVREQVVQPYGASVTRTADRPVLLGDTVIYADIGTDGITVFEVSNPAAIAWQESINPTGPIQPYSLAYRGGGVLMITEGDTGSNDLVTSLGLVTPIVTEELWTDPRSPMGSDRAGVSIYESCCDAEAVCPDAELTLTGSFAEAALNGAATVTRLDDQHVIVLNNDASNIDLLAYDVSGVNPVKRGSVVNIGSFSLGNRRPGVFHGTHVVVVDNSNPSVLRTYDFSNINSPVLDATLQLSIDTGSTALGQVSGTCGNLFVFAYNQRFVVVDLTDPSSPVERFASNTFYSTHTGAKSSAVGQDGFFYFFNPDTQAIVVTDVRNPDAPVIAKAIVDSRVKGNFYTTHDYCAIYGDLYLTMCRENGGAPDNTNVFKIDISNPYSASIVETRVLPSSVGSSGIAASGTTAYIAMVTQDGVWEVGYIPDLQGIGLYQNALMNGVQDVTIVQDKLIGVSSSSGRIAIYNQVGCPGVEPVVTCGTYELPDGFQYEMKPIVGNSIEALDLTLSSDGTITGDVTSTTGSPFFDDVAADDANSVTQTKASTVDLNATIPTATANGTYGGKRQVYVEHNGSTTGWADDTITNRVWGLYNAATTPNYVSIGNNQPKQVRGPISEITLTTYTNLADTITQIGARIQLDVISTSMAPDNVQIITDRVTAKLLHGVGLSTRVPGASLTHTALDYTRAQVEGDGQWVDMPRTTTTEYLSYKLAPFPLNALWAKALVLSVTVGASVPGYTSLQARLLSKDRVIAAGDLFGTHQTLVNSVPISFCRRTIKFNWVNPSTTYSDLQDCYVELKWTAPASGSIRFDWIASGGVYDTVPPPSITVVGSSFFGSTYSTADLSSPTGIAKYGNYCFVLRTDKLSVVDVSDPEDMQVVGSYTAFGGTYLCQSGSRIYIIRNGELEVVSIATSVPSSLGTYSDSTNLAVPHSCATDGSGTVWVLDKTNTRLTGVNVLTPSSMSMTGTLVDGSYLGGEYIDHADGYVYVPHRSQDRLTIYNVSSGTPVLSGTVTNATTLDYANSVKVIGNYAFVNSEYRLQTVDCTNKSSPSIVGSGVSCGVSAVGLQAQLAVHPDGFVVWTGNVMSVFDVRNPTSPTLFIARNSVGNSAEGPVRLVLDGGMVYFACTGSESIVSLSLTDTVSPKSARVTELTSSSLLYAAGVSVSGNNLYVARGGAALGNAISMLDITDPNAPSIAGSLTDATNLYNNYYIAGYGNYSLSMISGQITMVDWTTPSSPSVAATIGVSGTQGPFFVSGNYLYGTYDSGFAVWQLGAGTISLVGYTRPVPLKFTAAGLGFKNGIYVYMPDHGFQGINVVDVSTPSAPVRVGGQDSPSEPNFFTCVVVNGYLYAAGYLQDNSIYIYDISTPTSPTLAATITDEQNLRRCFTLMTDGTYLYAQTYYNPGVTKLDVSSPTSPSIVWDETDFRYMTATQFSSFGNGKVWFGGVNYQNATTPYRVVGVAG